MNWLGLTAAVSAFLGIWIGHVTVRKVEAASPTIWLPASLAALLGSALLLLSIFSASRPLSVVLGILGTTTLWDALEFGRQQRRVRSGHAPANAGNPRHARILAEPDSRATALHLLNRNPVGHPVTSGEAIQLITEH